MVGASGVVAGSCGQGVDGAGVQGRGLSDGSGLRRSRLRQNSGVSHMRGLCARVAPRFTRRPSNCVAERSLDVK